MNFLLETMRLGLTNLMLHKLRSLLTALGIILGVAAVIVMVAIGEGNKQVALERIRQLGARNIIIRSVKPAETDSGTNVARLLDYGLRYQDLRRIEATIEPLQAIIPLKQVGARIYATAEDIPATAHGTLPELIEVTSLRVQRGRFLTDDDLHHIRSVAVIGAEVAQRLFRLEDPIGSMVMIDNQPFQVVGILQRVGLAGGAGSALVGRDLNFDVYIPLTTAESQFGDITVRRSSGQTEMTSVELSELYLQAPHAEDVIPLAEKVRLLIERGHPGMTDVSVTVPAELLEQERSQRIMMDTLLVSIAAISLLVGGIGIMNIMLASVTERTREIGIRRAVGATRRHIVAQFLAETTVLSGLGGLIGIAMGVGASSALGLIHERIPGIELPQVQTWAIGISFLVATAVGIVFGLYPAVKASKQDPIVALRHD